MLREARVRKAEKILLVAIKLEEFKENYSHEEHVSFIERSLPSHAFDARTKIFHALDWELAMAREERGKMRK